jgi:hypothetical protein
VGSTLFLCGSQDAIVALVELRMRLIDSSVPDEIKAEIRVIMNECFTVAEIFR